MIYSIQLENFSPFSDISNTLPYHLKIKMGVYFYLEKIYEKYL